MALSTTTLSAAVGTGATAWPLSSSSGLSLPSIASGLDPVRYLFCDGEAANVIGFLGEDTVLVQRGLFGSRVGAHASGSAVYLAKASQLFQQDPVGAVPATPDTLPWINTVTGVVWVVSDGYWVPTSASDTATASVDYPADTDGEETLLASAAFDRYLTLTVTVTETFADGDTGTQPTFEIGVTGSADEFAATTVFVDAEEGETFQYSATLSADDAVIVTAVAATNDGTGALSVTAVAIPI